MLINLAAGDIRGQQIRSELDTAKLAEDMSRQLADGAGLRQPRQPFEQDMPITEQGDDQHANDVFLAEHLRIHALLQL